MVHLKDAVASKSLPRAEAVRLEFESRDAELIALGPNARAEARRRFNEVLSKLDIPQADAAKRAIGRIRVPGGLRRGALHLRDQWPV